MADPVGTTGVRACASLSEHSEIPDPVTLLLDTRQRQLEAWRALRTHPAKAAYRVRVRAG